MNTYEQETRAFYEALYALGCSACGQLNLEWNLCHSAKNLRECNDCCGCDE